MFYREPFLAAAREAERQGFKIDFDTWLQLLTDSQPTDDDEIMRTGDIRKVIVMACLLDLSERLFWRRSAVNDLKLYACLSNDIA